MLRDVAWNFAMYCRLLVIQLRSQMQFRTSFWFDMLSTGAGQAVFFLSFALIIDRFGGIAGWSLAEVAFLYGMIEASFGLMDMIFSGFDPDHFAPLIRQGGFDQWMLRPVGLTWQVLGSQFLIRRVGRILEGLAIFFFALSLMDVRWTLAKLLYLPVVFVAQVIVMGALFMIGSTISFWTLERIEAMNILTYGGTELMSYPMNVYPVWMVRFFTYAVPFIFLNYYPALYFLDKPDPLGFPAFAPFLAPIVALTFFGVALLFWRFGINHYQSSGT
jgi:ABC-2 type transport system permease protein